MKFGEWQDRRENESDNRGICRSYCLCDCRHDANGCFLEAVGNVKWILGGKMREIWNEYAEMLLGMIGAAAVTGIVMKLVQQGGSIYEILLSFSQSIC